MSTIILADYDSINVDDTLDIHKYLLKKLDIICLDLFKKELLDYNRLHNRKF